MAGPLIKAAWLAVGLAVAPAAVWAHALPGTVLTIASDDDSLDLTVTVPLHDLALVLPVLQDVPQGPVAGDIWPVLTPYFDSHLGVASMGQSDVPFALTGAMVQATWDDHLGDFDLMVLTFAARRDSAAPVFPLILTYDAVIHEIRNQTVLVWVQTLGAEPVAVGWVGINLASGRPNTVVIPAAP